MFTTALEKKYLNACYAGDVDTIIHMINKEGKTLKNHDFLSKCLVKGAFKHGHIDVVKNIFTLCAKTRR